MIVRPNRVFSFQFPLAERTSCNERPLPRFKCFKRLSVSSSGTNELQRGIRVKDARLFLFQFPLAERTSCNDTDAPAERNNASFQFPLAERTSCNGVCDHVRGHPVALSVSSSGTNELQQSRFMRRKGGARTFSFL